MEIPEEAKRALLEGNTIEAIKITREVHNLGLKEAKDIVDAHKRSNSGLYPKRALKIPASATFWAIVLLIAVVIYQLAL